MLLRKKETMYEMEGRNMVKNWGKNEWLCRRKEERKKERKKRKTFHP